MAGKATYTSEDIARLYVVLASNDGNVKRTARETGIPESTVRRYKGEFERNGPPSTEMVEAATEDFVSDADRVRFKALRRIEELIPDSTKINELNNTVGILTDKIDRARGLDRPAGDRDALPTADVVRETIKGFVESMRDLSRAREAEIVEAEVVEQVALPSGG